MPISRAQNPRELEPGLNALFGMEYDRYEDEHKDIFQIENSIKAYEEEVLITGFGAAPTKAEGAAVAYDTTSEGWLARYNHETIALAFSITEEAVEDNLYERLSARLTKALARAMAHTKQVKGSNVLNNAFSSNFTGGDGVSLISTAHPLKSGGTFANRPTTDADLSESSLEDATIAIMGLVDDRNIPIHVMARKLVIPRQLVYVADRLLKSDGRVQTADNDENALKALNAVPEGAVVNHRLTDPDAWYLLTDVTDGLKHFVRIPLKTAMEGEFESGNVRYKARERYSFGWSDWRSIYGSAGA